MLVKHLIYLKSYLSSINSFTDLLGVSKTHQVLSVGPMHFILGTDAWLTALQGEREAADLQHQQVYCFQNLWTVHHAVGQSLQLPVTNRPWQSAYGERIKTRSPKMLSVTFLTDPISNNVVVFLTLSGQRASCREWGRRAYKDSAWPSSWRPPFLCGPPHPDVPHTCQTSVELMSRPLYPDLSGRLAKTWGQCSILLHWLNHHITFSGKIIVFFVFFKQCSWHWKQ